MTEPSNAPCVVVDTNVLAVAEGLHAGASEECKAACRKLASHVAAGLPIVVDSKASGEQILLEYLGALRGATTSDIGSKLATYLWHRRGDPSICRVVDITPMGEHGESFEEVPERLRDFDNDDHKWVAVALAEPTRPQVFQALDTEWWDRRRDFAEEGIDVQFLCSGDLLTKTSDP
jgi:hypothetical protein